jgi:hypothetical protein
MLGMKRKNDIAQALNHLIPGCKYTVRSEVGHAMDPNDPGVEITWDPSNAQPQPSNEQILATIPMLEANESARVVREVRDEFIKQTDWTELPSIQANRSDEWKQTYATYRQTMRDLPTAMANGTWTPIFDEHGMILIDNWPQKPKLP